MDNPLVITFFVLVAFATYFASCRAFFIALKLQTRRRIHDDSMVFYSLVWPLTVLVFAMTLGFIAAMKSVISD